MNTTQYAKLAAVAIGAALILYATTGVSRIFYDPHADLGWSTFAGVMLPVLMAGLLAWLLYRYARSLEFDDSAPSGINLVEAGIKLLGAYWIVTALPNIVTSVFYLIWLRISPSPALGFAGIADPLIRGLVYGIAGIYFVRRTETIKKLAGISVGASSLGNQELNPEAGERTSGAVSGQAGEN